MSLARRIDLRTPEVVRLLRVGRGLSQGELARRSGISQATLSNLERGLYAPTLGTLFAIADELCCEVRALTEGAVVVELHGKVVAALHPPA